MNFTKTSGQKIKHKIYTNKLRLKVNDTYEKDEKLTTNFEARTDEDVTKKTM